MVQSSRQQNFVEWSASLRADRLLLAAILDQQRDLPPNGGLRRVTPRRRTPTIWDVENSARTQPVWSADRPTIGSGLTDQSRQIRVFQPCHQQWRDIMPALGLWGAEIVALPSAAASCNPSSSHTCAAASVERRLMVPHKWQSSMRARSNTLLEVRYRIIELQE